MHFKGTVSAFRIPRPPRPAGFSAFNLHRKQKKEVQTHIAQQQPLHIPLSVGLSLSLSLSKSQYFDNLYVKRTLALNFSFYAWSYNKTQYIFLIFWLFKIEDFFKVCQFSNKSSPILNDYSLISNNRSLNSNNCSQISYNHSLNSNNCSLNSNKCSLISNGRRSQLSIRSRSRISIMIPKLKRKQLISNECSMLQITLSRFQIPVPPVQGHHMAINLTFFEFWRKRENST